MQYAFVCKCCKTNIYHNAAAYTNFNNRIEEYSMIKKNVQTKKKA
jgi:hypothetical protein